MSAQPQVIVPDRLQVHLQVNGTPLTVTIDPRTTLLDLLRESLRLTGTKKGCDHGLCGACTVSIDGERVLAVLPSPPPSEALKS